MCEFTGLESAWCSHCTGSRTDVIDPEWDSLTHDYIQVFGEQDHMAQVGGHAFNPTPDQFSTHVEMADIYGQHEAVRLQKRRK